jgi:tetratricopeptide (TPR) repeat protein
METMERQIMRIIWLGVLVLLFPAVSPVHGENAMDYFNLGLKSSMTRKKIEYFTKALECNPRLAAAYEKRGLLHYFQGNYDKVIQDYQAHLDFAPTNADSYRMLGMGFLKSGIYESAIDSFTQAVNIDPKLTGAYAHRAEAYRLIGKDHNAIRDATTAIELRLDQRSRADAYRTRARVYRKFGHMKLAVEDIRAAVKVDPRIPRFWRYYLSYASPEELRTVAPFFIIAVALVLIFGLRLKPPKKDD